MQNDSIEKGDALRCERSRMLALRAARLERDDTVAVFAERLGVSERTVRAMERGLPTVQIGTWIEALWVLDRLDEMRDLLAPRESLIERIGVRVHGDLAELGIPARPNVAADHLENFWMLAMPRGYQLSPAFDLVPDIAGRAEHTLMFGEGFACPTRGACSCSKASAAFDTLGLPRRLRELSQDEAQILVELLRALEHRVVTDVLHQDRIEVGILAISGDVGFRMG